MPHHSNESDPSPPAPSQGAGDRPAARHAPAIDRLERFHASILRLRQEREALLDDFLGLTRPAGPGHQSPGDAAVTASETASRAAAPEGGGGSSAMAPAEVVGTDAAAGGARPAAGLQTGTTPETASHPTAFASLASQLQTAAPGAGSAAAGEVAPEAVRWPRRVPLIAAAVAVAVIIVAVALLSRGAGQRVPASTAAADRQAPAPAPPGPASTEAGIGSPPPRSVPRGTGDESGGQRALRVELVTSRPVWIRAIADGRRAVEALTPAERTISIQADAVVTMRIGDAGAVRVRVNGVDEGLAGRDGHVVNRRFEVTAR